MFCGNHDVVGGKRDTAIECFSDLSACFEVQRYLWFSDIEEPIRLRNVAACSRPFSSTTCHARGEFGNLRLCLLSIPPVTCQDGAGALALKSSGAGVVLRNLGTQTFIEVVTARDLNVVKQAQPESKGT